MEIRQKKFSLILPCYNEEAIFEESIQEITKTLDKAKIDYEIIFVEDASTDNTKNLIKEVLKKNKKFKAIFHKKNLGRGGSVAEGIKVAKGKIVGFIDIDLEVSPKYIPQMIEKIDQGYDIVCGKRYYDFSLQRIFRDFLHTAYLKIADMLISLPVSDPNGAYKFFKREKILPIIDKTLDKHWFWETELLKRASLEGLKIIEVPVKYSTNYKKKTTVKVFQDTIYFIKKLFWFKKELERSKK
ncbi:MAG: glycosyltransferase family 2 protein [Candidatus Diapherotrites archaeon]